MSPIVEPQVTTYSAAELETALSFALQNSVR